VVAESGSLINKEIQAEMSVFFKKREKYLGENKS